MFVELTIAQHGDAAGPAKKLWINPAYVVAMEVFPASGGWPEITSLKLSGNDSVKVTDTPETIIGIYRAAAATFQKR